MFLTRLLKYFKQLVLGRELFPVPEDIKMVLLPRDNPVKENVNPGQARHKLAMMLDEMKKGARTLLKGL